MQQDSLHQNGSVAHVFPWASAWWASSTCVSQAVLRSSRRRHVDIAFSQDGSGDLTVDIQRDFAPSPSSCFNHLQQRLSLPCRASDSFFSVLPLPLWHSPGAAQTSRLRQFLSILHFMALSVSASLVSSSPAPSALSRDGLSFFSLNYRVCGSPSCPSSLFHSRPCATTGSVASLIMYKKCSVLPAKKQQLLLMCCFANMLECCACDQDTGRRSTNTRAPRCKSSSETAEATAATNIARSPTSYFFFRGCVNTLSTRAYRECTTTLCQSRS